MKIIDEVGLCGMVDSGRDFNGDFRWRINLDDNFGRNPENSLSAPRIISSKFEPIIGQEGYY